ncbi:MAG: ATP-dependent helicase [Lachnospiraceae bacterium]|nr:ATP-dependent helicase [Lachnospiraceae bacterium]
MKFNEAQKIAIEHKTGPMLVLAGPGSGKTAVITRRVLRLVRDGVAPGNILVITFTKAAATEMQERYEKLLAEEGKSVTGRVNFGTFHAVFYKILKYTYRLDSSNIIGEEDCYQLLLELTRQMDADVPDEREFVEAVRSEISKIKSERIDIETYYSMNCPEEQFRTLYRQYIGKMKQKKLMDFDDILLYCHDLLKKRPDVLARWQEKYRYILIDEFQDINQIQYDVVRMLAKPQDNLFIVGDDDQSIYRFRGAKPEIMLRFPKDYPQAEQVLLNYNYRSQSEIVKTALRLISNNKKRFTKEILSVKDAGLPVVTERFPTQEEENERIVEVIRKNRAEGTPYEEIALLFRTNTQARSVIGKLLSYNIPFQMRDVVPNLFEHWIAKNIIAYIRMALGERERGLFLQIMNRPNRYIARDVLTDPEISFDKLKGMYREKDWMVERIDRLEYDLSMIAKANPYAAINYIRRGIGYDTYLEEYAQYRRMKPEDLLETVTELHETARGFDTFEEWFAYIEQYKEELAQQKQWQEKRKGTGVVLSTMHSSKGLEYETVILPDVNEGLTPYKKAVTEEELEEERRMYYVAMTRAKKYLYVYSVVRLHGKEAELSRFVGEMAVPKAVLAPGTHLAHSLYGEGILIVQSGQKARVYFETLSEEKVLDLEHCRKHNLIKVTEE